MENILHNRNIFLQINKEYPSEEVTEQVISFISKVRNSLINLSNEGRNSDIVRNALEQFNNPVEIYNKYMNIKQKKNWIDFDDILCISNNVLSIESTISKKYKNKFDFIQVDEAQDISLVQYEIIKKLAKNNGNLCLISDDDQCIYTWRSSDPSILLNFKKEFPSTVIIYMERNFRSAPYIVEKCNNFIKGNKKRYNKNMYTENKFDGLIGVLTHDTVIDQSFYIINKIIKENDFKKTAILYRNNSSALPIILQCIKNNVPFNITVKENSIFKQFILDDILNFYIFANDMTNKEAFLNIAYKTDLIYLKKEVLNHFISKTDGNVLSALDYSGMPAHNLANLKIGFNKLAQSKNATEFLQILFDKLHYEKYILKKADENSIDILYALAENEDSIETVIEKIAQLLDKLFNKNHDNNGIFLMTIHSSKGLEWENVYLIDFFSAVILNEKSDEEEERRVAYVGFSRAIKNLYISYYLQGYKPLRHSKFITELLPETKETSKIPKKETIPLFVNTKIIHSSFGTGIIVDKKDSIITVDFNKYGVKKLNQEVLITNNLIKVIN